MHNNRCIFTDCGIFSGAIALHSKSWKSLLRGFVFGANFECYLFLIDICFAFNNASVSVTPLYYFLGPIWNVLKSHIFVL